MPELIPALRAPIAPYKVAKELGHGIAIMEMIYARLCEIRHGGPFVDFTAATHAATLGDRLAGIGPA